MKKFLKRLKAKWDAYLNRMANTNEQLYGKGRLDCCDLNKSDKKNHRNI